MFFAWSFPSVADIWHFIQNLFQEFISLSFVSCIVCVCVCVCVCVWVLAVQLCPTLWDPMDCNLPASSVHGILQARILEWVAIPFFRGSSRPRDQTWVSCTAGRSYTANFLLKPFPGFSFPRRVNQSLLCVLYVYSNCFDKCLLILFFFPNTFLN